VTGPAEGEPSSSSSIDPLSLLVSNKIGKIDGYTSSCSNWAKPCLIMMEGRDVMSGNEGWI
jgi:hypothetical protein